MRVAAIPAKAGTYLDMENHQSPVIVVKIGGSTLGADDTSFADVASLRREGARVVVVHGGGPAITSWMAKLGVRAEFTRGLRVTDAPSLEIAVAVLAGLINKRLVAELRSAGADAVGISGADGGLLRGAITDPALGFVAGALDADVRVIEALTDAGCVPVVAPIAASADDPAQLLNANADSAAGTLAAALGAERLVFLTDVDGALNADGRVIRRVPLDTGESLLRSGVIKGGMIPKLEACLAAARAGTRAGIINGTRPGALPAWLDGSLIGTAVG